MAPRKPQIVAVGSHMLEDGPVGVVGSSVGGCAPGAAEIAGLKVEMPEEPRVVFNQDVALSPNKIKGPIHFLLS